MKITYIVSGIKRSVFFENTAIELKRRNYEIDFILVGNLSNDFELFLTEKEIKFTYINLKGWPSYLACIKQIFKVIKHNKPDIVHTHLTTANILGLTAARLAGVRIRIFTEHTGKINGNDIKARLYNYIKIKSAVYAVAITEQVKNALVKQRFKVNKIQVIHHGFNIERFQQNDVLQTTILKRKYNPKGKYPVIGLIARSVEMKGIQYAIPAFKKLILDYPDALLCLFSFSEAEEYSIHLNQMLENLPADSYIKVEFENNVYDMYQLFDIFVHIPTNKFYEAFGQVYIEALASGIPSVFTLSGIANDIIINNENAIVVGYKNSEEVYQGLKKLLNDKAFAEHLASNGRIAVKTAFDFEVYMNNLHDFYKRLCNF